MPGSNEDECLDFSSRPQQSVLLKVKNLFKKECSPHIHIEKRPPVVLYTEDGQLLRMFSVESAVKQLKPDFILNHVLGAEKRKWAKVHLQGHTDEDADSSTASMSSPTTSSSGSDIVHDPGTVLLRHGTSVGKVHSYFSKLEFRKCCLLLAGRKSTVQSMRVVHSSSNTVDDGSAKKERTPHVFVPHLEEKELRAFKHAYLCAAYPVLAAPDPPSPLSPSPVPVTSLPASPQQPGEGVRLAFGKVTPHSLHDSGLEESEDLAFIPSESICNHLQRAFHLSDDKFRDYRYLINKTYVRKTQSAQKLLAEQLRGQLVVLENHCHPFYKPRDFFPPRGYDQWRQAQYKLITELLSKFWQYALPEPQNQQDLMGELHGIHDDYRILLIKLLAFERESRDQTDGETQKSPLSSASIRLLREFGLRFGVGELYRRILYLEQVSLEFSPTLGYLRHILVILHGISELMPLDRLALAIVRREIDMLVASLVRLSAQAAKALEQMKSLFPNNKPVGGVELLIKVIHRARELRIYLQPSVEKELPVVPVFLRDVVQGMFFQRYEKCKTVIRTELKHNRDVHVCPRMLNALIMEIRDEVLDYKNCFDTVFASYFEISVIAAKAFYAFLMKDVEVLCQQVQAPGVIDLRMLALVFRLNQLDSDWSVYIKPQHQLWRRSFQTHVTQWCDALDIHVQDIVLETIAGDAFVTQQLYIPNESSSSTSSSSGSRTARSTPFTSSVFSAFSSIRSTPTKGSVVSSQHIPGSFGTPITPPTPTRLSTHTLQTGSSKGEHSEDFLMFAEERKHCASMPLFKERPAIVRVMSDTRMVDQAPGRILHASALDDLTRDGDQLSPTSQHLTVVCETSDDENSCQGDYHGRQQKRRMSDSPSGEPYLLDSAAGMLDSLPKMMIGDDSDVEEEEEEENAVSDESFDEVMGYPKLQDVTDINVTTPTIEDSVLSQKLLEKKAAAVKVNRKGQDGGSRIMARSGPLRSISQEQEEEQRLRSLGSGFDVRRQSLPNPNLSRSRGASQTPHREQLSAFQAVPQKWQQARAFRKISSSSCDTDNDHPFLTSVVSTVSFPTPVLSQEVIIPVSGSNIDLIVLLQRTLSFGHTLCHTLYPRSESHSQGAGPGGGVETGGLTESGDASDLRSLLDTYMSGAHTNIVEVLCKGISVYADNMLCLDLCAVPKDVAKRIIGSTLVDHMTTQRKKGKIWGCRHQLEGLHTCFAFHNRKAALLADRYEPITLKMCMRINNIVACQGYVSWCVRQTNPANFQRAATTSASTLSASCSSMTDQTCCDLSADSLTGEGFAQTESDSDFKLACIEETSNHLMSVWTSLCRLLAFRINLFLSDGLGILLSLKPADVPISTCLLPLTAFLRSHLDALSSWLYHRSFRRVTEYLWIFIVQDIETEACKLKTDKKGPRISPHILLQALMHLMKFMNNQEKGITKDMLLSQADAVVTKLQLFTLSTLQLIALYQRLIELYCEEDSLVDDQNNPSSVPVRALHQLRRDLQTRRKCFSGAQLFGWIMRNADLFMHPDELSLCKGNACISTARALEIAQHLLDVGCIVDVESEDALESLDNSFNLEDQYPEVSVHDHLQSSGNEATPTPTATPTQPYQHRNLGQISAPASKTSSGKTSTVSTIKAATESRGSLSSQSTQSSKCFDIPQETKPEDFQKEIPSTSGIAAATSEAVSESDSVCVDSKTDAADQNVNSSAVLSRKGAGANVLTSEKGFDPDSLNSKQVVDSDEESFSFRATTNGGSAVVVAAAVHRESEVDREQEKVMATFGNQDMLTNLKKGPERKSEFEDSGVAVCHDSGASGSAGMSLTAQIIQPIFNASKAAVENSLNAGSAQSKIVRPTPRMNHSVSSSSLSGAKDSANLSALGKVPSEGSLLSARVKPNVSSLSSLTASLNAATRAVPRPDSVCDLDMNSLSGSPNSISMTPFNLTTVFDHSPHRFYFMPPNVTTHPDSHHYRLPRTLLSPIERSLLHLKNSEETDSLAEKCFTLKVTPVSLLMVVYGRRRTDELAQMFVSQLPPKLFQQVSSGIETKDAECSVL